MVDMTAPEVAQRLGYTRRHIGLDAVDRERGLFNASIVASVLSG